ncbi:MAG: four helix bundle protein [Acidobacteria bacterium]|nr:four helix bundle protein [Acidobacteriota bacterium]
MHHLSIAKGSLMEVETHLIISIRLQFTTREEAKLVWQLSQQVGRLLNKLINSLNSKNVNLNPEPRTLNPEPRTPNPEPRTPNPEP